MTERERVKLALTHHGTDIVPYNVELTSQSMARFCAYTGQSDPLENIGNHLRAMQYWGWPTETESGNEQFLDDFGVTWDRRGADKDIGVVNAPVLAVPDISLLPEPKLNEARLRAEIEEVVNAPGERFRIAGIGFSLYERFWSYCGIQNALEYLISEPDFTDELFDRICEFDLRVIRIICEYDVDGVYFGDDWGAQKGLIMGPRLWRRFIRPRLARLYAEVKKNGRFVLQHSCGDIHDLFPDLIEIGLDCYQTFQPEIYDIESVKREYGADLSFWGGISTQKLLPVASAKTVYDETHRFMDILGKNGGYICSPTHAVPADVPPENIASMIRAMRDQ